LVPSPAERAIFIGIQRPGETPDLPSSTDPRNDPANPKAFSSWPDGDAGGRPRPACVVITTDDGGEIGS
jgi:secreted PhoX family phosphatase